MNTGDRAIWLRERRGGYAYIERVAVRIVEIRGARARVSAQKITGEVVERWVNLKNLVPVTR